MDEKKPQAKAKGKEAETGKVVAKPKTDYLIDWKEAAEKIEAELKAKDWTSVKQRRNPAYLSGLVKKHILGPLVRAIHKKGV